MELAIAIAANIVIGVVLLALFAWHRAPDSVRLATPEEALAIYRQQFPGAAGTVTVSADGLAALVSLQHESKIGLIHRHGRRWCVRELLQGDLQSVTVNGDTITLSLADFGWPRGQVRIADSQTRASWHSQLQTLATHKSDEHSPVTPHA